MPQMRYIDVNGTKCLEFLIKDTKAEQELMAIFAKAQQSGFVTAHQWLPGIQNLNRADTERCVSRLRLFTAPVIGGKAAADLPESPAQQPEPGKAIGKPESLDIPPEIDAMGKNDLLSFAPRVGAKVNPRMEDVQIKAAICLAIKRNPKNWESARATLAAKGDAKSAPGPLQPAGA